MIPSALRLFNTEKGSEGKREDVREREKESEKGKYSKGEEIRERESERENIPSDEIQTSGPR